jgi:hypothetical protein
MPVKEWKQLCQKEKNIGFLKGQRNMFFEISPSKKNDTQFSEEKIRGQCMVIEIIFFGQGQEQG